MANNEEDILARTIWGEARNQGVDGMQAVASVILNRVKQPKWWGKDIVSVCTKPYQFSCWLSNDPNLEKLKKVDINDPQFRVALHIAQLAVSGGLEDNTDGATYYYERHMKIAPKWAKQYTFIKQIKDHLFYKE